MTPKSNNSQHQMTSEQAAAGIRGSAADHWTNLVIQQIRDGEREPLFTPGTFASAGSPAEDI